MAVPNIERAVKGDFATSQMPLQSERALCLQGSALVKEVSEEGVTLLWNTWQDPGPPPPIALLLAMPRPKVLRRLWRVIPELGVKQVVSTSPFAPLPALPSQLAHREFCTGHWRTSMCSPASFFRLVYPLGIVIFSFWCSFCSPASYLPTVHG
jgi:hypothetical protein